MKSKPLISVVIPAFNVSEHIYECIKSITYQDYSNLEIIVINDGSTDDTLKILRQLELQDSRIKIYTQNNKGVSSARNYGIRKSTGVYITFIDADDFISKDYTQRLLEIITASESDIAICKISRGNRFTTRDRYTKSEIIGSNTAIERLLYQKGIDNGVVARLYRKSVFEDTLFNQDYSIGEDLDISYRIFLKTKYIALCNEKLYCYTTRYNSAMNKLFSPERMQALNIAEKIYREVSLDRPALVKAALSKVYSEALYSLSDILASSKNNQSIYQHCINTIDKYAKIVALDKNAQFRLRIYAVLSIISPVFMANILRARKRLLA